MTESIKPRLALAIFAAALLGAACSSSAPGPATQTATDGTFEVTISVPAATHHASDALDIVATLTYQGPEPSIAATGDDAGLVSFSFKQLDGTRSMVPVSRLICGQATTLQRGVPATFRPEKSVAFEPSGPDATFYRQWAADPQVHLSAGRWQVVATAVIFDGMTCMKKAPDHTLTTPPLVLDLAR
jgi:hypothetical protein